MRVALVAFYRSAGFRAPAILLTALLALSASGCTDTCVSFNSNPPDSSLGVQHPCPVEETTGTVSVRVNAAPPACPSCANATSVQHVYVGVKGIELQPKGAAGESPEWQMLPRVAGPVQVDLLAWSSDACSSAPALELVAPAGVYRSLRLRLVNGQSDTEALAPGESACGILGYNCIVLANGRVLPLVVDEALDVAIASENQGEGLLFVLPGARTQTTIRLQPELARFFTEGGTVRFLPAPLLASRQACLELR